MMCISEIHILSYERTIDFSHIDRLKNHGHCEWFHNGVFYFFFDLTLVDLLHFVFGPTTCRRHGKINS